MKGNTLIRIKNIFSKPRFVLIAAAILFLPFLFIGTRTSHDWGDDFAQYIHQAENIVLGIPQSETGFIYSQQNFIGPRAYPAGFPLMLAPVYAISGNSILAFTTLISVFYFALGMLMLLFYRRHFSWITALTLTIILLYNPQMILFKREIMSDIPFTALLVLNFIFYQKLRNGNLKQLLVLSVTTGFMLTIRPAGFVFIAAVVIEQLLLLVRRKIRISNFAIFSGALTLIPILIYFSVNSLIFKIPSVGSVQNYLLFFSSGNFFQIIPENLGHHFEVFSSMFVNENGALRGFSFLLGPVILTLTLLGFLKRLIQGPKAMEWFFLFYLVMLLIFPSNHSAFRLMVPLGFIFLFYAAIGIKTIQLLPGIPGSKKAIAIGILIVLIYLPSIIAIARSQHETLEGPQQGSAISTFNYIRNNVPPQAVVVFAKPRALALYAGCHSLADPFTADPTSFHVQVMEANASYLLINKKISSEPMKMYARVMQNRITKKWENSEFTLYRINGVNP